jgi:type IV pilus assembly protein PilM
MKLKPSSLVSPRRAGRLTASSAGLSSRAARLPRGSFSLNAPAIRLPSPSLKLGRHRGADVVGLDIQPGFIAAVEAHVNGSIRAVRAVTATLEGDIVPEGEVADEMALSAALRDLFADSGMGRRVRVGVANQRTVLRILEMPPLDDPKELAAAVRFQAQDQVPMPLSNAVLDFHSLGMVDTPAGPRQRVVLVAAQRDMIERLVSAVRGAGLRPVGVDLSAFALIRALFHADAAHDGRVLYLNVDGLTNLAIAEGTSCRFNRVIGVGLEGIADELARRSGVSRAEARELIAAVDLSAPPLAPVPMEESRPAEARPSLTVIRPAIETGRAELSPSPPAADVEQLGLEIADPAPAREQLGFEGIESASERPSPDDVSVSPDFPQGPLSPEQAAVIDAREVREMAESFSQARSSVPAAPRGPRAPLAREVRAALEEGIRELVSEVRNTLDFHASQEGGGNVSHVVLSGQALNVPGFAEKLQEGLGIEVQSESVELVNDGIAQAVSAGRLAVAAGLATAEAPK